MTADVLDAVATDWRPSRVEARRAVRAAIVDTAAEHDGLVHIAWVRPLLPTWIDPHQIGAVVCSLVRQGRLVSTGRTLPNGLGSSRNRAKAAHVYRLTGALS